MLIRYLLTYRALVKISQISACVACCGLVNPHASFNALSAKTGMSSGFTPNSVKLAGIFTATDNALIASIADSAPCSSDS